MAKNTRSFQSENVKNETSVFEDTIKCHELPNRALDIAGVSDKYGAAGERLLSPEPSIISAVIANKKESRINKDETFNCFVIDRSKGTLQHDELELCILKIKKNINNFPDPTRFQLNVFDWGHWYPIDFYIKDGEVNIFIFDASSNIRAERAHEVLEANFPTGKHYQFAQEFTIKEHLKDQPSQNLYKNGGYDLTKLNIASIQKSEVGCRVFSAYHAMNIAKEDPEVLYADLKASTASTIRDAPNIPPDTIISKLYDENPAPPNTITLRSMQPVPSLVRLIRPIQSYSKLQELSEEVMNTTITSNKGNISLKDYTDNNAEIDNGRKINATILNKSQKYRQKVLEFKEQNSQEEISIFISQRAGFAYLDNPHLFTLDKLLSTSDKDEILKISQNFASELYEKAIAKPKKNFLGFKLEAQNLRFCEQDLIYLRKIIEDYENGSIDKGKFVAKFMARIAELQETLKMHNSTIVTNTLNDVIEDVITNVDNNSNLFTSTL